MRCLPMSDFRVYLYIIIKAISGRQGGAEIYFISFPQ